jgi:hypothetical protein
MGWNQLNTSSPALEYATFIVQFNALLTVAVHSSADMTPAHIMKSRL